jgi:peptide/nickel transport system permease protein
MSDVATANLPETDRKRRSPLIDFVIRLVKEKPLGTAGGIITLLLLFTGIFADFLAPYGMNQNTRVYLAAPSVRFLLGTDHAGRDILSRIIFGARISVIVGLSATTLSMILTMIIGTLSGYIGGKFDLVVQRIVDTVMCIPSLIILIVIISMIGPGMWQVIIALGINWGIGASRVIRSATLTIKENVYIKAAKASGCSHLRILVRHILPNIMAPAIIEFSIRVPAAILHESSLSFLGYGIPPPAPSWGGMLTGFARHFMFMSAWPIIWPGLALSIVVYFVNMFGDAVRDILDPRLRGGVGRYDVRKSKNDITEVE